MGARIGVGVCTYNRPKHLVLWLEQVRKYTNENEIKIYIAEDMATDSIGVRERKGIAYRKNECLRVLKDCDYIFLFDDDCFPIKEGWAEFFINQAQEQKHFIYLRDTPTIKKIKTYVHSVVPYRIDEYNNCSGCMMFFTKEVIEKVGAYNPKYGFYGWEHAGYSNRIHKAGLTPLGAYTCPAGAGEYIYSMDLDFHLPFNRQVNHKPSIDMDKLTEYVEQNKPIYLQDIEIYIPL